MTGSPYLASPYRFGEGWIDYITVGQPSAGAAASMSVPGQYALRPLQVLVDLTTAVAVADRFVAVDVVNPNGVTWYRNVAEVAIPASQSNQQVVFSPSLGQTDHAAGAPIMAPLLACIVPPGWTLQIGAVNLQAADQLAAVSLVVEKIPTGATGDN